MIIEIPVRIEIGPEHEIKTLDQLYEELTKSCNEEDASTSCINANCIFKDKKCSEITIDDWKKVIKVV